MPAILGPAAQNIQNNRPGTFTQDHEPASVSTGAPASVTPTDIISDLPTEYGGLSHIFSDSMPAIVETAVTKPTDSIAGKLGGLVPHISSPALSAGPAAPPPPATADPAVKAVNTGVVARVRKSLRI